MDKTFDYSLDYKNLDLRLQPELYRMGKGEQGVLMVEPYKSEILPYWKFKTPADQQDLQPPLQNFLKHIRNSVILQVWIWQESFYKWVIPAAEDMQTMQAVKNMMVPFQQIKKGKVVRTAVSS